MSTAPFLMFGQRPATQLVSTWITSQSIYYASIVPGDGEADYFVDFDAGSDSNDGSSWAQAKLTMQAAAALLAGTGGIVKVRGTSTGAQTVTSSGALGTPIEFWADSLYNAVVNGAGSDAAVLVSADYLSFHGLEVYGANYTGIRYDPAPAPLAEITVRYCYIRDLVWADGGIGGGHITINGDDCLFDGNLIVGGVPGAGDAVLTTMHGIYSRGLRHTVRNNIIVNIRGGYGIHAYSGSGAAAQDGYTAVNNTTLHCNAGGMLVQATNMVVANNITAYNNDDGGAGNGWGLRVFGADSTGLVTHNLFWQNENDYLDASGVVTNDNAIFTDPAFVNYQADGSGDYRALASGAAFEAASPTYAPTVDYYGNTRAASPTIGFAEVEHGGGGSSIVYSIIGVGSPVDTYTTWPKTGPVTVGDWFVDPNAASNGVGTEADPFDNLASAISAASLDDVILVKAGTLTPSSRFILSGSALNIYNYGTDRPIIDCSALGSTSNARVFTLTSGGHHIKGFEIIDSAEYPVVVNSAGNMLEDLHIHGCARTNVYLFGSGANNNLVQDVWSWDVRGSATAPYDDDNFASTANSGSTNSGNEFIRILGANGPDDGLDLFRATGAKAKSSVMIGSGYYNDGSSAGDGNGFKMGGQGGPNSVEGSIAVGVKVQGFDANSQNNITFLRNTSVRAGNRGFNVYSSPASGIKENLSADNGSEQHTGTLGTYNSWNDPADAGGDAAFPLTLAEIDFADPASSDYSLDTNSEAIGAGESGGNPGASEEALDILKDFMALYGAQVYHR